MSSLAATYYVTTIGNDGNLGSSNSPWLTVQKAANSMVAGDSAIIAEGTYAEVVQSKASGTAGSPITFTGSGQTIVQGFGVSHDWNYVDNFTFTTSAASVYAAIIFTGNNIRITRNLVHDFNEMGVRMVDINGAIPSVPSWPTNVYIAGNTFSNLANVLSSSNSTVSKVIGFIGNYSTIESNRIDSCACDAINVWGSNNSISRNVVTNILRDTLWPLGTGVENHNDFIQTWRGTANWHSTNNVIEGNLVINSYLQMANVEDDNYTNDFGHWTFRNNVFVNNVSSMNIGIPFCTFENNTFYRSPNGLDGVHYWSVGLMNQDSFHGWGAVLTNNLFIACGFSNSNDGLKLGYYAPASGAVPSADYNYVAGLTPGFGLSPDFSEPHGINGSNPLFVDGDNGNVRLLSNSPAIGKGTNLSAYFTTDIAGNIRTGLWDIGAWKFIGATLNVINLNISGSITHP